MNSASPSADRRHLVLIAGILLIATTLRVAFTGAAPLLDAIRSEYGGRWAVLAAVYQTATAWVMALLVYQGGRLLGWM